MGALSGKVKGGKRAGKGKSLTGGSTEAINHPNFKGKRKNFNKGKHSEEDIHVRDVSHSSSQGDGTAPPRVSNL